MWKAIYVILIFFGLGQIGQAYSNAENINQQLLYVAQGCFILILARLAQAEDMRLKPAEWFVKKDEPVKPT